MEKDRKTGRTWTHRWHNLLWAILYFALALCLAFIAALIVFKPTVQSTWFGTQYIQVEIGPQSWPRSPGPEGQVMEEETMRLDPRIKQVSVGYYGSLPNSRRDYAVKGDWITGICKYDGRAFIALGEIEIRVWKCSP